VRYASAPYKIKVGLICSNGVFFNQYGTDVFKPMTHPIADIEHQIRRLTPDQQLRLMEKIAQHLRKSRRTRQKELDWDALYGLGRGLAWGIDAQEYVNTLREDRE
jgi:hypothetical protein